MKLALRNIPAEVWVDIFRYPWISRKQLGKIVDRFRNRKFTEILQYCLHDMGKRTLGYMYLNKGAIIPQTPVPDNIKFFQHIMIKSIGSNAGAVDNADEEDQPSTSSFISSISNKLT